MAAEGAETARAVRGGGGRAIAVRSVGGCKSDKTDALLNGSHEFVTGGRIMISVMFLTF